MVLCKRMPESVTSKSTSRAQRMGQRRGSKDPCAPESNDPSGPPSLMTIRQLGSHDRERPRQRRSEVVLYPLWSAIRPVSDVDVGTGDRPVSCGDSNISVVELLCRAFAPISSGQADLRSLRDSVFWRVMMGEETRLRQPQQDALISHVIKRPRTYDGWSAAGTCSENLLYKHYATWTEMQRCRDSEVRPC